MLILFVLLTVSFLTGYHQHCIHDAKQKIKKRFFYGPLNNSIIKIPINPLPFGIHFELTDSFRKFHFAKKIDNFILKKIKNDFKEMIKVKYPKRPLLITRNCVDSKVSVTKKKIMCILECSTSTTCNGIKIPEYMLKGCFQQTKTTKDGAGIPNVDIVLFVSVSSCKGPTLAYAAFCSQEEETDRPIAGTVNICSNILNKTNMLGSISILKHQILHALGFSKHAFGFFRDEKGFPTTLKDMNGQPGHFGKVQFTTKVAKLYTVKRRSTKLKYSKQIWGLQLPNVLAIAAHHFGCPNMKYFPIENFDGNLFELNSHFDELVGGTELMTPNLISGTGRLSKLTLAFLEDTGWYIPEYSKADNYNFGQNKGCDFVTKGCYNYMIANPTNIAPFCNTLRGYTDRCSDDGLYVKRCVLTKHTGLDPKYQYFSKINGAEPKDGSPQDYAGSDIYSEYCPSYELVRYDDHSNLLCRETENRNKTAANAELVPSYFGKDSLCFGTTSQKIKRIGKKWDNNYGAACFKYICDDDNSVIVVKFRANTVAKCKYKGEIQTFTISEISGSLECQSYTKTCGTGKKKMDKIAIITFINSYLMIGSIILSTIIY